MRSPGEPGGCGKRGLGGARVRFPSPQLTPPPRTAVTAVFRAPPTPGGRPERRGRVRTGGRLPGDRFRAGPRPGASAVNRVVPSALPPPARPGGGARPAALGAAEARARRRALAAGARPLTAPRAPPRPPSRPARLLCFCFDEARVQLARVGSRAGGREAGARDARGGVWAPEGAAGEGRAPRAGRADPTPWDSGELVRALWSVGG